VSTGSRGGQERIEYLGEVSRTETGRRESVVRGESKTKTTTGYSTTKYTNEGQGSNVKTYTSGTTGFGQGLTTGYTTGFGQGLTTGYTTGLGQGLTTGLTEVSRQVVG